VNRVGLNFINHRNDIFLLSVCVVVKTFETSLKKDPVITKNESGWK